MIFLLVIIMLLQMLQHIHSCIAASEENRRFSLELMNIPIHFATLMIKLRLENPFKAYPLLLLLETVAAAAAVCCKN